MSLRADRPVTVAIDGKPRGEDAEIFFSLSEERVPVVVVSVLWEGQGGKSAQTKTGADARATFLTCISPR
jgi:hypothetical protein